MPHKSEPDFEFLDSDGFTALTYQQKVLYAEVRDEFIHWLRQQGKQPQNHTGYDESNIRPIARRVHQTFEYAWRHTTPRVDLAPETATQFLSDLNQDQITTSQGDIYCETSKRKFKDAIATYFRFQSKAWDPEINFSDNDAQYASDPFSKQERHQLLNAAFEYRTPPSYSNLSPEERDRWKGYLAQCLGMPKANISRSDWEKLQRTWKVPSIMATALDAGWRAALVGRLRTDHVDVKHGEIHIPAATAVKNDSPWTVELSERSTRILERYLRERANRVKYDSNSKLWLNRNGNPYNSKTLNTLLDNLQEIADITPDGRKLTWHSIRHSTGMYIYDTERDLGLVAEILRHKSLESARKYAHPTPETKQDVVETIQGGGPSL
jgi:integrase